MLDHGDDDDDNNNDDDEDNDDNDDDNYDDNQDHAGVRAIDADIKKQYRRYATGHTHGQV